MDNAIDALKIAFAVFVFVMALSISMKAFGQAKLVADEVFYMTDKTNFYEYTDENNTLDAKGRIVSGETIIPTLYRYYKENFNVIIQEENKTDPNNPKIICVFNLEDEIKAYSKNYKDAPWLGNANVDTKKRVDYEVFGITDGLINNVEYENQTVKNTNVKGLLEYTKRKKFKETFKEERISGKEITVDEKGNVVYVENIVDKDGNIVKQYSGVAIDPKEDVVYTESDEYKYGHISYKQQIIPTDETLELVQGSKKITIIYTLLADQ